MKGNGPADLTRGPKIGLLGRWAMEDDAVSNAKLRVAHRDDLWLVVRVFHNGISGRARTLAAIGIDHYHAEVGGRSYGQVG